jgi:hypothetical protein
MLNCDIMVEATVLTKIKVGLQKDHVFEEHMRLTSRLLTNYLGVIAYAN